MHESVQFGGGRVMIWAGVSINGLTDLYSIMNKTMTFQRYRDEILRPIVVPYAASFGDEFILMDDNARQHRARLSGQFSFRRRNPSNGLARKFPRHEHIRTCLGHSTEKSS
uniref:Tc1-like transposase DDE domain-containing protein n=2 Tax=Araneus ventricosus TaxID=182803 RepID=A0A4Y2KLU5_ARAVE|nr:hypothetical protein AVEN_258554-1 [Araneus ventricosus]GBN03336.1 hypothetical protein AVEN_110263-1 [Araneus ventricosus]GBN03345.1 hypothetical protein AVEN_137711-1 [Araneus ventricosus]